MVATELRPHRFTIVLSPNRSATWQQSKLLIFILGGVTLIIATIWTLLGVWLVLPFAGLEVSLLAYLTYRVSCYTYQKQIIEFTDNTISILAGRTKILPQLSFARDDCYLVIIEPEHEFDTTSLVLTDHQHSCHVGKFLNEQDISATRAALKKAGIRECPRQWWKH
ncbi:DUF2244 domain-containing protein [Flocculibacter collagenilyticus]|uniref:DUF2244 domain-containing protein n=1 Tax=Flocculibacter collagenilyticus TaxID=2744479 RepID=UPI0018F42D04|nr:DUF2244 domain-containing protein [Flocculibacter collagenilyticus]